MRTVWAISRGDYSDYSVYAMCLSKRLATQAAAKMNTIEHSAYDAYRVEELVLIESINDVFAETMYCVEVSPTGDELRRWTTQAESWSRGFYDVEGAEKVNASAFKGARGRSKRGYDVALKAARDKLTVKKAEAAGLT